MLLRDRNLPPEQQQLSFVFAAPLWTRAAAPVFRGWLVLGLPGLSAPDPSVARLRAPVPGHHPAAGAKTD